MIIKTPWLLSAPASPESEAIFLDLIQTSLGAGVEVVVPEHSIDEVHEVLARVCIEARQYEDDMAQGVAFDVLLATSASGTVITSWLEWAEQSGILGFGTFERHVFSVIEGLPALGVTVRPHHNDDAGDLESVAKMTDHLSRAIDEASTSRGDDAIERDAHTAVMAWRHRKKNSHLPGALPTSWVVTTDRRMGEAYARFSTEDGSRIAITPSQWAGILAACLDPVEGTRLAESAASLLTREAGIRVAAQWPPRLVLELSKALRPETGITSIDIRLTREELGEYLANEQDTVHSNPEEAGATMASTIVARRTERTRSALADRDARYRRTIRQSRLGEETASERERQTGSALARTRDELQREREARESDRIKARRRAVSLVLFLAGVFATILLFIATDLNAIWFGTGISTMWLGAKSVQWSRDHTASWTTLLVAGLPELLGVLWQVMVQ